jgi:Tol biopolymer transport system component
LNTGKSELQPALRKDGLEIFFVRGMPGYGLDLYVATRETTQDLWSIPVNLALLNSTVYEYRPVLSWDGTTLIFASERLGTFDLFMSTRTKLNPQK